MKPKSLKENEEVIIVREDKKKLYYEYAEKVLQVIFPDDHEYPNGDYSCYMVLVEGYEDNGLEIFRAPEPHGRMSREYYLTETKPVSDDLALQVAVFLKHHYGDGIQRVPRRKFYYGR